MTFVNSRDSNGDAKLRVHFIVTPCVLMRDDIIGQAYFDDLADVELLDKEEERRLMRKYEDEGDLEARNKVIKSALKFVVVQARRFANDHDAQHRLISAGNEGLLEAVDRYDIETALDNNNKFLSYAYWHITERMRQQMRSESTISIPSWRRNARRKIEEFIEQHDKDRSELSYQDIADGIGMEQMSANRVENLMNEPVIETDSKDDIDLNLKSAADPEDAATDMHASEYIQDIIAKLRPNERLVIRAYYGIGMESKTYGDIGDTLGMSHEAARQIAIKAKNRIKRMLRQRGIDSFDELF